MAKKIYLLNRQRRYPVPKKTLEALLLSAFYHHKVEFDEVNFHFVGIREITALHRDFFDDPTPTDCITLPIDSPNEKNESAVHLGDVFVCPQVAFEYAETHKIPYEQELFRYAIHGLLHLLGYNDITQKGRQKMRQLERLHLKSFPL